MRKSTTCEAFDAATKMAFLLVASIRSQLSSYDSDVLPKQFRELGALANILLNVTRK